ncbi:hypothetical protein WA026_009829 [Henosepilachna vigintioctopunctata]|uniref:Lipase n=1 Tax=Henosepilachna vigintioctopunctata TaxID=420089 RepID=A0AAW1TSZ3_9CUCU
MIELDMCKCGGIRVFLTTLLLVSFTKTSLGHERNVCPTFEDYYTVKNNTNCWYDVAAEHDAQTIIKAHGYELKEFKVQTNDGYILTLFKISSPNTINYITKYYPVFLQHGLLSTSANFIALGRNSLAFMLADAGHDVWLGNYRGTQYSEGHINYTVNDKEFWDHTLDDMVKYDFPAVFHQILSETPEGGQIIYIGHSLGTTLALMYNAQYPKEAKNIFKLTILLSPAYTLSNMLSPYRNLAPFGSMFLDMANRMDMIRLMSQSEPLKQLARTICLESPRLMQRCLQMWNLFYGAETSMAPEIGPVYFNQIPGGSSFKVCNHAADLALGNFRHYNHGPLENVKRYGTPFPPIYDIQKIQTPIYIVYSIADWATTEKDAWNLYNKLPKLYRHGIRRINMKSFNHIDFVFGKNARRVVYEDLLLVIKDAILKVPNNV